MVNESRTHMSRIETANCAVSLDVVFDICDALCVKPCKNLTLEVKVVESAFFSFPSALL